MKRWITAGAVVALGVSLLVAATRDDARPPPSASAPAVVPAHAPPSPGPRREAPSLPREATARAGEEPEGGAHRAGADTPPTVEEVRDHIETVFAREAPAAPGADLSLVYAERLRAVIPAGAAVRRLECRGSLCRIETTHPSLDAFRDFAQRAYTTLDSAARISNGPVFTGLLEPPVEGQPVTAVAYLGREGTHLPIQALAGPPGADHR